MSNYFQTNFVRNSVSFQQFVIYIQAEILQICLYLDILYDIKAFLLLSLCDSMLFLKNNGRNK